MSALRDWVSDLAAQAAERPLAVGTALAVGLALGVGVRDLTGTDGQQAASAPVDRATPAAASPRPEPRPQPAPEPQPRSEPADASARVEAALRAVQTYSGQAGSARVGAAIVPLDGSTGPLTAGTLSGGKPWSMMKVPAAAAYLEYRREAGGAASGEATIPEGSPEREGLGLALVQSDNLAIRRRVQEMVDAIGAGATAQAINAMLEQGGSLSQISPRIDPSINSLQLGTGTWSLVEAAQWIKQLQAGCLGLAEADRAFLLRQLRAAPTALPWGAAAALDTSSLALKPGWGSGSEGYTVGQIAIVGNGPEAQDFPNLSDGYAIALMAVVPGSDESAFGAGQEHLQRMAERIDAKMGAPGPSSVPASGC